MGNLYNSANFWEVTDFRFTFRYRSLFEGSEALKRQLFNVPSIDF